MPYLKGALESKERRASAAPSGDAADNARKPRRRRAKQQ